MEQTSYPSIAACNAHIGSTSVTITLAPPCRSEAADPLPTSPKPATTATLPDNITSVALRIPSTKDSLQPYRLSNLDFVTESFTLMAGNGRSPFSAIWYNLRTPVVVSSVTPFMLSLTFVNQPGELSNLERI